MKIYAKPIKMLFGTDEKGKVIPIKFQMQNESKELISIKIDQINFQEYQKEAGQEFFLYRCQSVIEDVEKVYELKFLKNNCKWLLWKM